MPRACNTNTPEYSILVVNYEQHTSKRCRNGGTLERRKNSELEILANLIRRTSLAMVYKAKASHIGSAFSISEILAVLYGYVLKKPDVFILSKGHATVALYAALKHTGENIDLESYGADNSSLMHHASHHVPNVVFSTGSLGHGLPFGLGKAFTLAHKRPRSTVYVLLSDGEMQEGSNWEAIQLAGHLKLRNLVVVLDANGLQSLGEVKRTLNIEPLVEKFSAFGWHASEIQGHDIDSLIDTLQKRSTDRPTAIIARTIKGKGVSFMENQVAWHYKSPSYEEFSLAMKELENAERIY
jgi:transketolase